MRRAGAAPAATALVVGVLLAAVPVLLLIAGLPTARSQLLVGTGLAAGALVAALRLRAGVGALAFAVVVLTAFLLPLNRVRLTGWVTWADVTLVLAIGLALLQPAAARRSVRVPRAFAVGMLVLLAAGAAGSLASPQPVTGLANFARLMVTAVASVAAVLIWRPERDRLVVLIRAWLAGNAVNVAAAVVFEPRYAGERPAGLTTHPNALGLICVLSLAFAFALYDWGGRADRALALTSMAAALVGAVLSGSRAAILAVAVVVLVRGVLVRAWLSLLAAGALLGTVALVGGRYLPGLGDTTALGRLLRPDSTVGTSDEDRLGRLRSSVDLFVERPVFGSGFANATDAHNVFLQVLVAAGLIGLAGFLLACWPMVAALWRGGAPRWRVLALLPIGFLADAMFSNNLWDRYIWLPLALGLYATTRTAEPDRPGPAVPVTSPSPVSAPAGRSGPRPEVRTKEYT